APGYSAQLAARSTERNAGVAQLVSAGVLAIGSYLIFRYHWHRTRTLRGESPVPPQDRGPRPPRGPRHLGRAAPTPDRPVPPPERPVSPPERPVPPPEPPAEAPPEEPPSGEAPPPVVPPL
ncbi:MAG: hypothetical protein ABR600_01115, partial [Actinomycetota bacterium]